MLKDKSILDKFDLVEPLNNRDAEVISGGLESFQIKNTLGRDVIYSIDGADYTQKKDSTVTWVTTGKGTISFDASFESGYQDKTYNLTDNRRYEFQYDSETWWNSDDFELYFIGYGLA